MTIPRITVLVSGRGSNLAALLAAERSQQLGGTIVTVISSDSQAPALAIAAMHDIAVSVVKPQAYADRAVFEAALASALEASEPDVVVLAGFTRILSPALVGR